MRPFVRKVILFFLLAILSIMVSIIVSFILEKDFGPEKDDCQKCSLVDSNEMGYHVSVLMGKSFISSGALIGNRYVLTTAEDLFDTVKDDAFKKTVKVHVGTRTLPGGTAYAVEKITCHPAYDGPTNITKDNIAVLRLAEDPCNDYVYPISLPGDRITAKPGLELIVSGFAAKRSLHYKYDLHKFPVKVVRGEKCRKFFDFPRATIDFSNKFCAFYTRGHPSQYGDAGSPAVTTDKAWTKNCILGITLTNRKYKGSSAELFIDVSSYEKFIRDNIM